MWEDRDEEAGEESKAVWTSTYVASLPDSAFLFVEPGEKRDGKRHLPYREASGKVDVAHLRNAISRLSQTATGQDWLTPELRKRLQARARKILADTQKSLFARMADVFKSLLGIDGEPDDFEDMAATMDKEAEGESIVGPTAEAPFTVWKSNDGTWRWLAIFTNRYRDKDNPPEILTEAAHRDFEKAIDSGEWPMPELWPWHVPYRIGVADGVAYDDCGFMLATGTFDDAEVGQRLAKQPNLGVSHGMPTKEIRRDEDDSSLIVRYRTREISPLPMDVAANPYTGFMPLEGKTMALSGEKAKWLRGILGDGRMVDLEAMVEGKSKETEGVEFKEEAIPLEEVPTVEIVPEVVPEVIVATESIVEEPKAQVLQSSVPEVKDGVPGDVPLPVSREEIADAIAATVTPLVEQFGRLVDEIAGVKAAVKELRDVEAERAVKEKEETDLASMTPAASLHSMVQSRVIGARATKVAPDSELAQKGPAIPKAGADGPTPIGLINAMMPR
jgi:hypothetical protein